MASIPMCSKIFTFVCARTHHTTMRSAFYRGGKKSHFHIWGVFSFILMNIKLSRILYTCIHNIIHWVNISGFAIIDLWLNVHNVKSISICACASASVLASECYFSGIHSQNCEQPFYYEIWWQASFLTCFLLMSICKICKISILTCNIIKSHVNIIILHVDIITLHFTWYE